MKRLSIMFLFIALFLLLPNNGQAQAASKINTSIVLDGQSIPLQKKDNVEIVNGSVMVPLRIIAENLGLSVVWDQKTSKVSIPKEYGSIELTIGNKTANVDGTDKVLTAAPLNRTGTTLVPLRFISESMGMGVKWDNNKKIVSLTTPATGVTPAPSPVSTPQATPQPASSPAATPSPAASAPVNSASPAATAPVNSSAPVSGSAALKSLSYSENRLMVALEGNVVPQVHTVNNPTQIVVDLPQTAFAASFGSGLAFDSGTQSGEYAITGYPDVSKVRYELSKTDASTVRLTLELNGAKTYTSYTEGDVGSSLFVLDLNSAASPSPTPTPIPAIDSGKKTIVIDAGHGDGDPGGIGATKKQEKWFTLALALKVEQLLKNEPAFNVVLTRNDDTFIPLGTRAAIANDLKADAFISIHANIAPGKPSVRGTETYYYNNSSKSLADTIHKHLVDATGFKDRKVKYNTFQVLRKTTMPATLMEVGFLSNSMEEATLFEEDFQLRVAASIVDAIKEYFGVS